MGGPDDLVRLGTFTLSEAFVAWLSGALKESQVIMMATLRSIGDAVIATDRRGSVRFLNPVAEVLTGWSQEEAKGRPLTEVFQTVNTATGASVEIPLPEMLRDVFALPENIYLISKSCNQVFIDASLAPVQIDSGRTLGEILVFRDATRRRQNEAALLEAERQRLQALRMESVGRLAGGVAHEFNNLLTIINGHAALVLKQIDYSSQERDGIEEIRKAGERAASLTRQLLVISRGQPVKLEVVDLNQVVANFEKMLRRLIREDIELVTILANELLLVRVDVGQIEQVMMNLAVNARDAMPNGGRLTLETQVEELVENGAGPDPGEAGTAHAVLSVTDTGIGIDPRPRPTYSNLSSPRERLARAPGSGCLSSTALSKVTMATCGSRVSRAEVQSSKCVFHAPRPRRKRSELPPFHRRLREAQRRFYSWKTILRSVSLCGTYLPASDTPCWRPRTPRRQYSRPRLTPK